MVTLGRHSSRATQGKRHRRPKRHEKARSRLLVSQERRRVYDRKRLRNKRALRFAAEHEHRFAKLKAAGPPSNRLDRTTGHVVSIWEIEALVTGVDDEQPPADALEGADAEVHTVAVFEPEYIAENGDHKTFRIDGPDVVGQEPGLAIEYHGSFDGFETVPMYVHAGGDGGPQSADAHGFVKIVTDAMVPQVGHHIYGYWAEPTLGFAAGWYRGVVAVREQ